MKTMKIKKIILGLLLLLGLALLIFTMIKWRQETRAGQIIHSYMVAKGIDIKPGTEEYQIFMRDILWGAYPELFSISNFINNEEEVVYVHNYAYRYSGYEEVYGKDLFSIFLDNLNNNNLKEAPALPTPTP